MKKTPSEMKDNLSPAPAAPASGAFEVQGEIKKKTRCVIRQDLDQKLQVSLEQIIRINDILSSTSNPDDIRKKLKSLFRWIYRNTSVQSRNKFKYLLQDSFKSEKKRGLRIKRCLINEYIEDEEVKKLVLIHNGIARICEKIDEINLFKKNKGLLSCNDPEIFFYEKIKGTEHENIFLDIFGTKEEYEAIVMADLMDFEDDPDEIPELPENYIKIKIYRDFIQKLCSCKTISASYDGLAIDIFLEDYEISRFIKKREIGAHAPFTIFNLIRKSVPHDVAKMAVDHEGIHNSYYAFFPEESVQSSEIMAISFQMIEDMIDSGEDEEEIRKLLIETKKKIGPFFSGCKDEIIANFDYLKEGKLMTAFAHYQRAMYDLKARRDRIAGKRVRSGLKNELIKNLDDMILAINQFYASFYKRLADLVYIAEKEHLDKELFANMILFDPVKYHRIEKYFKKRIGKEKYDYHVTIRSILKPQFFELPKQQGHSLFSGETHDMIKEEYFIGVHDDYLSSKRLAEISGIAKKMKQEDLGKIKEHLEGADHWKSFSLYGIDSCRKFLDWQDLLFCFMKKIGLNERDCEELKPVFFDNYDAFVALSSERLRLTEDMLDSLPEEYDRYITDSLKSTICLIEEDEEKKELLELLKNHPRTKSLFD